MKHYFTAYFLTLGIQLVFSSIILMSSSTTVQAHGERAQEPF